MVQCLLKVPVLEVGFSKFRVGSDQNEQVFLVDVDEEFAERELLNANLDHTLGVLTQRILIKCFVSFNWGKAKTV